jgi:hypothetical protein
MGLVNGIWLAVLGVLGASNLIIARKPDAKELIGKLAPYQGWIGAVSALWGIWGIISSVLNLGWMAFAPIYWITYLVDSILSFCLGLLLGVCPAQVRAGERREARVRDVEQVGVRTPRRRVVRRCLPVVRAAVGERSVGELEIAPLVRSEGEGVRPAEREERKGKTADDPEDDSHSSFLLAGG